MTLKPLELSLFETLDKDLQLQLRQSGVVPVLDPFMQLWNLPEGTHTVVLMSGRGTGKTHVVSDLTANVAAAYRKRCAVLRDEKSRIKETILNEILLRYDDIPYTTNIERKETGLKDKKDGKELVFTMGFKASSNAKTANMKGVSDIDIAIIEEAEDIRDVDKFNSFTDGLRKEGCLVIIILNTPDMGHWILRRYFDITQTAPIPAHIPKHLHKDFEGYFKCTPKVIPGFVGINATFRDNNKLPAKVIREYEEYGDPSSSRYNPHHYMTSIEGYASSGRKGQILKNVKPITLEQYMALPFKEIYGQDFGTSSPAGLVGVKFDKDNCYCRQLNYEPMATLSIAKLYCSLNFLQGDKIVGDCADSLSIEKLKTGYRRDELLPDVFLKYPKLSSGFFVIPCVKGTGSIEFGLGLMNGMNLFAVTESVDLWNEIRNYVYAQDKYGNYTNDPIDNLNHLIDPWRYVVSDFKGSNNNRIKTGKPIISKNSY